MLIGSASQLSICLHDIMGTDWKCLVSRLSPFGHMYSLGVSCQLSDCLHDGMGTHWSVFSVVLLSKLCHGYSFWCLVNCLFVSRKTWETMGVGMAWVLIGVSSQSFFCLNYVMGTHFGVLSIVYLFPTVIGTHLECLVNRLFCLYEVAGTYLECLFNRLLVSMVSKVLIVGVLSIVYLSPWC